MKNYWIAAFLTLAPLLSKAEIVIVSSTASTLTSATKEDLERLYLGKSKSLAGTSVNPINQTGDTDASSEFNKLLLNRSSSQVKAYWSKLVFTGKGMAPKEVNSNQQMIEALKADPEAVGYIDASAATGDVKVLLKLE